MRFFRAIWLRLRLCWNVVRGRHLGLYANILAGNPTAYRVAIEGAIQGGDKAIISECLATVADSRDGIVAGDHSLIHGCTAYGIGRYGLTFAGKKGAYGLRA